MNRLTLSIMWLLCRAYGHDWRRPTVAERAKTHDNPPGITVGHLRICRRCGAKRWATPKPRKR